MTDGLPSGTSAPTADAEHTDDAVAGRVVRGGAQRVAGLAISNLLIAASTVLLLRHLGVAGFGQYGTVMALMTIVTGITDAGLNVVGTRELALAGTPEGRRRLTAAIVGIRIALAALGVCLALLYALASGYKPVMITGTVVAGVGVVLISVQSALCLPSQASLRNGRLALVELSRAAVAAVLTAIFVALGAGLLAFFAVQTAIGVLVLLALPLLLGAGTLVAPRYDREEWARVIKIALPVAIAGVLSVLYLRIIVVLAWQLTTEYEVGLLSTSARLVEVVAAVPLMLVGVLLPVASVAARDNPDRFRYVSQRMLESGVLLGIAAAIGFGFGARPLVITLGSREFADAAPVLAIQGLTILTVFLAQAGVIVLLATHHQAAIVRANVAGLIVMFIAGYVLLGQDGARGGAIATVIADLVLAVTMLTAARRAGAGFTLGLIPRTAAAGVAGVAVGVLTLGLAPMLTTVAALLTFAVLAVALRGVPSELLDAIRRR